MLILASLLVITQCMWFDINDVLGQFGHFHYVQISCNAVLELINPSYFWPSKYGLKEPINRLEKWKNRTDKGKGHLCPFSFDKNVNCDMHLYPEHCKLVNLTTIDWQCSVPQSYMCNGISECLTDECGCGEDVFRCADGLGCIATINLCDGYKDCRDGSDECMCDDVVTCHDGLEKFCVPKEKYQTSGDLYRLNCSGTEDLNLNEARTLSTLHQLKVCIDYFFETMDSMLMIDAMGTEGIITWCHSNCNSSYLHYCDNLVSMSDTYPVVRFRCEKKYEYIIEVQQVCDGTLDCDSGEDEAACPGRYYCKDGWTAAYCATCIKTVL